MSDQISERLSEIAAQREQKKKKGNWAPLSTIPHKGQTTGYKISDTEGTTPKKHKESGQGSSDSGFPKGPVGTGGSWTPD